MIYKNYRLINFSFNFLRPSPSSTNFPSYNFTNKGTTPHCSHRPQQHPPSFADISLHKAISFSKTSLLITLFFKPVRQVSLLTIILNTLILNNHTNLNTLFRTFKHLSFKID